MGFRGVNVRQAGDRLLIRAMLYDSANALVTSGAATARLYELQSDASLKSYDFTTNTFKTTALTTETVSLTHRAGNNGTTSTGLWTYALTNVSGFTAGGIYFIEVIHASAVPTVQGREFQYGGSESDTASVHSGTAQGGTSGSLALDAAASANDDYYLGQILVLTGGTGADQARVITDQSGSTVVVSPNWITTPDTTTTFAIMPASSAGYRLATEIRNGTAQAGTSSSITLDAGASNTDDWYKDTLAVLTGGQGAGQARLVTGYTGATKVAAVAPNWALAPGVTTAFTLVPAGRADLGLWLGSAPNALAGGRVDASAGVVVDKTGYTASTVTDKTGYTVSTVGDKTGYSLAAAGLDAIAVTDPGAPTGHTTIPKMVVALWRWFYKKTTLTSTTLRTFADDNTAVNASAAVSDDGTTQTKGPLS